MSRRLLVLLASLAPVAWGCSQKVPVLPEVPNQRPVVRLTQAPANSTDPYFYAYEIFWTAYDPDGRVIHFLYAVDPPGAAGAETTWVRTTANRQLLYFRSDDPDSLGTRTHPGGFHVFVIKAVDDRGAASPAVAQAFYSYTVAPTVTFIQPRASHLLPPIVPPTMSFRWTGEDPDGIASKRPLYYRWRLFSEDMSEMPFLTALVNPDSLRRRFAPEFAGWDSISGDTCWVEIERMIPNKRYLLAVVAIDEAGAYSPVFSLDGNLLFFYCQFTAMFGPQISVWNGTFSYTYLTGGWNPDPALYIPIEVPWQQPVGFFWSARANSGTSVRRFRWCMDIGRLDDETPRDDEYADWNRWSRWSSNLTSAVVGPFPGGTGAAPEEHLFYIEAEDNNGLRSLGIVQIRVVKPTFNRDLLFVDDTRFAPDQVSRQHPDSVIAPAGLWPSAAELDTFLFARGGVRWRYYQPATLQSPPGIFNGYTFDTIGTRALPAGRISLSLLASYRHVVWYSDQAPSFTSSPIDSRFPMPLARWLNTPGQFNPLVPYGQMGGNLWLLGGGFAYNSLLSFNVTSNDAPRLTFSRDAGELRGGRSMWDLAHWRSAIAVSRQIRATKNPALGAATAGSPDYSVLPAVLLERSGGDSPDPLAPLRGAGYFYVTPYEAEWLSQPNEILEDVDPDPDVERQESTLDTLYFAGEETLLPIMTTYRGRDAGSIVFSGFPLWHFKREQAIRLGDFVLQGVWGLQREPVPR